MLRGKLFARTRRHADHHRHAELVVGHMAQGGGGVHDLVKRQEARN